MISKFACCQNRRKLDWAPTQYPGESHPEHRPFQWASHLYPFPTSFPAPSSMSSEHDDYRQLEGSPAVRIESWLPKGRWGRVAFESWTTTPNQNNDSPGSARRRQTRDDEREHRTTRRRLRQRGSVLNDEAAAQPVVHTVAEPPNVRNRRVNPPSVRTADTANADDELPLGQIDCVNCYSLFSSRIALLCALLTILL